MDNQCIMDNKKLLDSLMNEQTDDGVTEIINSIPNAVWKEYGGNGDNIATIHGQMDDPLRCLVENVVNGIDSIKMLAVRKAGIDFSNTDNLDPRLPKSSKEVITKYLGYTKPLYKEIANIRGSRGNVNGGQVGVWFERLCSGDSCLQIYDYGEGQRPDAFENTLLSLGRGNKASLPFVQGKYNQGSTGVLKKCNGHRYELIVSMRNLDLPDADNKIGFTMVRYANDVKHNKKYRSYEFLTIDGEIPYVMYDKSMKDFFKYVPNFTGGCIRKLYSYNIKHVSDYHVMYKLNSLFYDTGIPVRVTVPRNNRGKLTYEGYWMCGANNKLLEKGKQKPLLHRIVDIVTYCEVSDENGNYRKGPYTVKAEYYVFPSNDSWSNMIINNHNISFIDGGQNNGDLSKTFISNECKMNQIASNIILFIHTDEIPSQFAIDMYKPSRDRIDEKSTLAENIISQLKDILINDTALRALNEKMKGATAQSLDTKKILNSIEERLSKNSTLTALFNSKNGKHLKDLVGIGKGNTDDNNDDPDDEPSYGNRKHKNVVISLKPSETKETTMAYNKAYGVELELEGTKDMEIKDLNGFVVDIQPLHLVNKKGGTGGKSSPRTLPSDTYSQIIEDGKLKVLVSPKTMGYYPEESFEISFNHIHDETFNAVVQVSVVEELKGKKNRKTRSNLNTPALYLTAKVPSTEGVIPWSELSNFTFNEDVTCKLIVEDNRLERIYVNLDSKGYTKLVSEGINNDTAKNNYIESVYVDALVDYTTLLDGVINKLCKDSDTFSEAQDTLIEFIREETERMNSYRKCII